MKSAHYMRAQDADRLIADFSAEERLHSLPHQAPLSDAHFSEGETTFAWGSSLREISSVLSSRMCGLLQQFQDAPGPTRVVGRTLVSRLKEAESNMPKVT